MAATLDELRRLRDGLFEARAAGVRRYRDSNGEEVEYRSDGEMARALAAVDAEIAAFSRRRPAMIYPKTSKGFDR